MVPFNVPVGNRNVAGDFHRPYESSETVSFYHSTHRPETGTLRAIFIAPTKAGHFDYFPLSNRVVRVWGVRGVR